MSDAARWSASLLVGGTRPRDLVRTAAAILGRSPEELLATGGDDRQIPRDGRNAYGFQLCDLDPVVRGSSCTATPPDPLALHDADRWRRGVLRDLAITRGLPTRSWLRAPVVEALTRHLGLSTRDDRRIVLTPSGTDSETLVAALATCGHGRPVRNVLVGALEAGGGIRHAATGRSFSSHAPFRSGATVGEPIVGFPTEQVTLVDVELRDALGRPRRAFDVEAEVEAHLEDAIECREREVVHVMAGSKTGLRHLDPAWVRLWRRRYPDDLRVVVDAAQGRATAGELRAYLQAGAAVAITGSKALCGPPFCGAIFLDDAFLHDARAACDAGHVLPAGLRASFSATDLPVPLLPLLPDAEPANLGLLARWTVALEEAARLDELPADDRATFTDEFVTRLAAGLARMPRVRVVPAPGPSPTIVSFLPLDAIGDPSGRAAVSELYDAFVSRRGVQLGQPVELSPGGPAALRVAVGATTVTRALMTGDRPEAAANRAAATAMAVLDDLLRDRATI